MRKEDTIKKLQEYLRRITDPKEDKCWFCQKTPDQIRQEFYEYMKNPPEDFEDIDLDDIVIMSYKTQKPICASCYFTIRKNPELIKEIFEKPSNEIW